MHPDVKALHMKNHTQALAEANHRAAQTMEKMGGGFAAALALAYYRADADNQARILGAFPDLFEKYRRIAEELREMQELAD
jgi:monomeric isocitrate dehydrogenase